MISNSFGRPCNVGNDQDTLKTSDFIGTTLKFAGEGWIATKEREKERD